jgi:hypothetical protein
MENEIKIGDKTFEFEIPNILDKSIIDMMNDWYRLIKQQKNNEDVWTVIPELPQYKFKNLQIKSSPFETTEEITEITIVFKYDEFEDLDNKKS